LVKVRLLEQSSESVGLDLELRGSHCDVF
jgi:hypothetical protein